MTLNSEHGKKNKKYVFLTENNIRQYEDLIKKIDGLILDSEQTADSLKQAEKKLSDMAVLIKNISTYQKTKDIYRGYIKAKNKDAYRRKHESSLILYEAATKALKDAGLTKLPNLTTLQKEYSVLQKHKEVLYSDYGKFKSKVKEYQKIKQNVDTILQRENTGKEHTKTIE